MGFQSNVTLDAKKIAAKKLHSIDAVIENQNREKLTAIRRK